MKYRIWFEKTDNYPEGWLSDEDPNDNTYREERKKDACKFTQVYEALLWAKSASECGYPCKVVPEPTPKDYRNFAYGLRY